MKRSNANVAKAKYSKWLTKDGLGKLEMWARNGLTDKQIAQKMNINVSTLYKWEKEHSEISESLKKGKKPVDIEVENALLRKALGGKVTQTVYKMVKVDDTVLKARRAKFLKGYQIEHPELTKEELIIAAADKVPTYERIAMTQTETEVLPDTTAIIYWLKNRCPDKWREMYYTALKKANLTTAQAEARIKKAAADVIAQSEDKNNMDNNGFIKAITSTLETTWKSNKNDDYEQ